MNRFFKVMTKVYESLIPDEETQRQIAKRYAGLYRLTK